jgi:hypothetical protein
MSTEGTNPAADRDVAPLGSTTSEPVRPRPGARPEPAKGGEDGVLPDADGMAGPVYPPPETEPDAQEDSTRRGAGRVLGEPHGG